MLAFTGLNIKFDLFFSEGYIAVVRNLNRVICGLVLSTLHPFITLFLLVGPWQVEMTSIRLVLLIDIGEVKEEHSDAEAREDEHLELIS